MLKGLVTRIIGSRHDREARKLQPLVDEINALAEDYGRISDDDLKGKTAEFRGRIAEHTADLRDRIAALRDEKRKSEDASHRAQLTQEIGDLEQQPLHALEEILDELLPEAFAVVKETCRRLLGSEVTFTGYLARSV